MLYEQRFLILEAPSTSTDVAGSTTASASTNNTESDSPPTDAVSQSSGWPRYTSADTVTINSYIFVDTPSTTSGESSSATTGSADNEDSGDAGPTTQAVNGTGKFSMFTAKLKLLTNTKYMFTYRNYEKETFHRKFESKCF